MDSTTATPSAAGAHQDEPASDAIRDIKRYKSRSKTDDTSLLSSNHHNSELNNENTSKKSNELDNGEPVIMSIQER